MLNWTVLTTCLLGIIMTGDNTSLSVEETQFAALRDAYLSKYRPLVIKQGKAWWEANTTGSDEAFKQQEAAQNRLVELHSDGEIFRKLKTLREGAKIKEPVLRRQLELMYYEFLPGQADPSLQKKIVALQTEVEKIFTNHRSQVDGQQLSENDVRDILADSKDSAKAEKAWKGYMAVGAKVEQKLKEAVKLRNELARRLGFRDFYAMQLAPQEIDEKDFLKLFDELDQLTRKPFADLKSDIDKARAKHFGISVSELRPWHFGDLFFQEAPELEGADLDAIYANQDLLALTKTYYQGLGMEVEDILARSDLYEKPGKSSHAFATDIDREGDIRVLCNLKPNLRWMDTLIHELGHGVYDKYIDPDLPFLLRTPSHSITTEGYAMMMGAMAKNQEYLTKVVKLSPGEAAQYVQSAKRSLRAEKLIFSRWAQVMVRFEHAMYGNPDQDLGKLWWDLKKKYQLLNPPENVQRPDYGAKIHIVTVPVYYHSYMMGDLFASQVHHYIASKVLGKTDVGSTCYHNSKAAGDYMKREIFGPGNLYSWNELTKRATGESLTAKYFVRQYVDP
ncbi:MAG: M2 family metallopeptidase [Phycisphaerales bacterium]|nr:M2 family metallopeptidase [Phycisphaerales bacterium]